MDSMTPRVRIYPVVLSGDPVLEQPAQTVGVFNTEELLDLLGAMFETMYASRGIGLAAPQIGISKRICVIDISGQIEPTPMNQLVLINPEVISQSGCQIDPEGCLSLPGFRSPVRRPMKITVRAQNFRGEASELEAEGLLARCMLHEIDHLAGKLFINHLTNLKRELIHNRIRKLRQAGLWTA